MDHLIPVASAMPFIMDGIMVGATQTRVMRNSMFWATAAYFGIFYIGHTLIGNNACGSPSRCTCSCAACCNTS